MPMPAALPVARQPRVQTRVAANTGGINTRDFERILKDAVLKLTGYWRPGKAVIRKNPGLDKQFSVDSGVDAGTAPTVFEEWFPGYQVLGFGKRLVVRDTIAGTTIEVKDDFTADLTDGASYGGYFYVADGREGDKIGYLEAKIAYDAQTQNFTVGRIVTGAISGTKAVILADADSGTAGTLTVEILNKKSFIDDEAITDSASTPGAATVNGVLTVTWTEISNAPAAELIAIVGGNRLAAGNTDSNVAEIYVSRVDTAGNVPFSQAADWATGTTPTSAFINTFNNAGELVGIGRIGKQIVGLHDRGKYGFTLGVIDEDGTGLLLDVDIDFDKLDFGATRGAVNTSIGIIYTNPAGVHIMTTGGANDVAFSARDTRISEPLGREFTRDFTFDGGDIELDDDNQLVLIPARNNSSINNVVLVYHLEKGLRGWATWTKRIGRLMKSGKQIFATDAGDTIVYLLDYDLGADNDAESPTELLLEWNLGNTEELQRATQVSISGKLGSGTSIEFSLDRYDRKWGLVQRVPLNGDGDTTYTFTAGGVAAELPAVGSGAIGPTTVGGRGIGDGSNLTPSRGQRKLGTSEGLRFRGRLTSLDKHQHEINLFALYTESRGLARTSNLT